MDIRVDIERAVERLKPRVRRTPLEYSPWLSRLGDAEVFLKLENYQLSGSFKIRGVMNALLDMADQGGRPGLVTASSGNHGVAFAHALRWVGGDGAVVVPETISKIKADALKAAGAHLRFHGDDCLKAETHAREWAKASGRVFLSPYNDPRVIAGQGSIGAEILEQWDESGMARDIDAVLVPVGGGGLISGVGGYLKSRLPRVKIWGCQPRRSAVMYHSLQAGRILDMESEPTISDGTAGGIEVGSITFDMCREFVDGFVLLEEEEIEAAVVAALRWQHVLIEGAAALPLAAFLKRRKRLRGKHLVLVLSGARIAPVVLAEIIGRRGGEVPPAGGSP